MNPDLILIARLLVIMDDMDKLSVHFHQSRNPALNRSAARVSTDVRLLINQLCDSLSIEEKALLTMLIKQTEE